MIREKLFQFSKILGSPQNYYSFSYFVFPPTFWKISNVFAIDISHLSRNIKKSTWIEQAVAKNIFKRVLKLGFSIEVHTLPTRISFSMKSGTCIYGLMTDLTFCIFFGWGSINGKKTHGESSFQRTSAALEPSVYFTFLTPWMGNRGYIVKFIRRCTLYVTLIPFHHVCINKGFTVCKKH